MVVVGFVSLLLFRFPMAILCRIFELCCFLGKYPSVETNFCQSVPLLIAFQITGPNQLYNRSTGPSWEIDWLYVCGLSWPLLAATEVWGQKKKVISQKKRCVCNPQGPVQSKHVLFLILACSAHMKSFTNTCRFT